MTKKKAPTYRTVAYRCPACGTVIGQQVPPAGELWDTLRSCDQCRVQHFVLSDNDTLVVKVSFTALERVSRRRA